MSASVPILRETRRNKLPDASHILTEALRRIAAAAPSSNSRAPQRLEDSSTTLILYRYEQIPPPSNDSRQWCFRCIGISELCPALAPVPLAGRRKAPLRCPISNPLAGMQAATTGRLIRTMVSRCHPWDGGFSWKGAPAAIEHPRHPVRPAKSTLYTCARCDSFPFSKRPGPSNARSAAWT